jgi:nicotinamide-nucleotide amidase
MRAQAATKEEAREIALALSKRVEAELGSSVFTRENEPLEAVLLRICRERKITMAVAESCTGGMIAEHITAIPGASESFRGAVVTYSDEAKRKLLNVSSKTLEEHGAVSRETAAEMAQGVRTVFEASLGVATTGIAGPAGGSEKTPLGTVFVAVADDDGVDVDELHIGGDRERVRVWATRRALNMMRRRLEGRDHPL